MKKNTLIWTEPPVSGLCDRLIDFCLMATYARLHDSNFSSKWKPLQKNYGDKVYYHAQENAENGNSLRLDSSGVHCKFFKDVRYNDYKPDNFLKYFQLPENTFIDIDENVLGNLWYYDGYIGGNQSPELFFNNFILDDSKISQNYNQFKTKNEISYDVFLKEFYKVCNEFRPTEKLKEISNVEYYPDLTIHLRREDKVRLSDDSKIALDYRELNKINHLTEKTIDSFLSKKPNSKILFCSDDENEKRKWEEIYEENIIKTPKFEQDIEQTYYDIYIMSISKNILLSQRYSGFSMFASFINKSNFIYLLKDSQITDRKYSELENFFYYEDWLNSL